MRVAQSLSKKINLYHTIYKLKPLRSSFLKKFKDQFLVPRILSKTSIVKFFKDREPYREINLSRNGAEIFRNFYKIENFTDIKTIFREIDVVQNTLQKTGLEKWITHSKEFSSKYEIEIQNLFYHEIRLGKCASQFYHELDHSGIEFFSPFNNKSLVYSIFLNINKYESDSSNEDFVKELMETMLEGSTAIPFKSNYLERSNKKNIPYNKLNRYYRALKNLT